MMQEQEAIKHLQAMKWHFAKSMPKIPHWYARRREYADTEAFFDVVKFIREFGVEEAFFKKSYIYFYHEGYKYWTMGSPLPKTILINKAEAK